MHGSAPGARQARVSGVPVLPPPVVDEPSVVDVTTAPVVVVAPAVVPPVVVVTDESPDPLSAPPVPKDEAVAMSA